MEDPIVQKIKECRKEGMSHVIFPNFSEGLNNWILLCWSHEKRQMRMIKYEEKGEERKIKSEDVLSY